MILHPSPPLVSVWILIMLKTQCIDLEFPVYPVVAYTQYLFTHSTRSFQVVK